MSKYIAEIDIMPHRELLDPQGKTVAKSMKNLHISGIEDVRIGKHIRLTLEADSEADANEKIESACKRLLANLIMETYSYSLHPADN
jgi:phosphoribosylformylglycinamidine synthase